MNNTNVIIANESTFLAGEQRCPNCKSLNLDTMLSKSNSTYYYCRECNHDKENSLKHVAIDNILVAIKNTLEQSKNIFEDKISIKIVQKEAHLDLSINNSNLSMINGSSKLNKNDSILLENTIIDLIDDYCDVSNIETSVTICHVH